MGRIEPGDSRHRPVVFLAPGSGLGHLVRTGALSLGLARHGIPSVILTTSPFGPGFSNITGIHVIFLPFPSWAKACPHHLKALDPAVVVLDTFPMGLRGENLSDMTRTCPVVVLARRLTFDTYRNNIRSQGITAEPEGFTALIIEPLPSDYHAWLTQRAEKVIVLENRIRFPVLLMPIPEVPESLERDLSAGDLHLVVHSGPDTEVRQLMDCVQGRMAVINPRMAADGLPRCYDYFPASTLYGRAHRIYTGAGYNAVSEIAGDPQKHILIPFNRRYDDQAWRKNQPFSGSEPGNATAIESIMNTWQAGTSPAIKA